MLLDCSQKIDLQPLAAVVQALQFIAQPMAIDFFLMGAAARDLMLHAHNVTPTRLTTDVDFAVMVKDWESFTALHEALIKNSDFMERPGSAIHRLLHQATQLPLDIVPFGGIERADRTIAWPPDQSTVFDCFGAREAFDACILVQLPQSVILKVASIPALALLKVSAWQDRKLSQRGKDAGDLFLFLSNYMDCGNLDRATSKHLDLFDIGDYEVAGAQLLGRDIALLLDAHSIQRVLHILQPEVDTKGPLLLASQSGLDLERARSLLSALCNGLTDNNFLH